MEVPLSVRYPLGSHKLHDPVGTVERIATPGDATSTSSPVEEKDAR